MPPGGILPAFAILQSRVHRIEDISQRPSSQPAHSLIRQRPNPPTATPTIIGGDDGAMRRGRTYGTLLGDIERHRPIDLLPARTADARAAWRRAHPGVTMLSRDRATAYARGATVGAPAAQQILDRWHLVRTLREALERVLDRRHRRLAALPTTRQAAPALASAPDRRSLCRSTTDQIVRHARRARRFARSQEVRARHAQGLSQRHIAKQLRMSRTTGIRYLRVATFPERAQPRRVSLLDPYTAYLPQRWDAGGHNGVRLWRAIRALGFPGTRRMVANWVVLRRDL
jgi:hypothetical protein